VEDHWDFWICCICLCFPVFDADRLIGAEVRGRDYDEECLATLYGGLVLAAVAIAFLWILPGHLMRFSFVPIAGSTPFCSYYLGMHLLGEPTNGIEAYRKYHLALQDDAIGFVIVILIPAICFACCVISFDCWPDCFCCCRERDAPMASAYIPINYNTNGNQDDKPNNNDNNKKNNDDNNNNAITAEVVEPVVVRAVPVSPNYFDC
jgi:hypothetical protein